MFGDPHERRLRRGGRPQRVCPQRALDPARDDRVLLGGSARRATLLAEVVIDRRVALRLVDPASASVLTR